MPSSRPARWSTSSGGSDVQSRASGACSTFIISAASVTLIVCGPRCDTVPNGDSGYAGTRPKLGLSPTLPQNAAGMRTDPAPSVPTLSGPSPAATAAAVPPDDPPGVFVGSHGLRVMPGERRSWSPPCSRTRASSSCRSGRRRPRAVGPSPARRRPTAWSGSTVWLPRRVGQPFVRTRSLIEVGTPSSGPTGSPRCQRTSLAARGGHAPRRRRRGRRR